MLETRGLTAHYGDFQALYGIDTVIAPGETIAIIGANGAGKSSYLKAITGLIRAEPDSVRFEDKPIGALGAANILKLGIAMVPEGRRLFSSLTVEENLQIGSYGRDVVGIWSLDSIYALFPALKERRAAPSHTLSGGEQQMAAIGRALMSNPRVLLCDEISLGLAPIVIRNIYDAMSRIKQNGTSIVLVEQDIAQAMKVADRVYCFQEGRVSLSGRPDGTYTRTNSPRLFRTLSMLDWLGTIIQGVLLGGLYALFAAGLSLIFGIMRLVNLAHGDLIVLAAFAILSLATWLGFDPFLAALFAMPAMFAAGFALQHVLLNRTLGRDLLPPLLVTFGLSIIIQNGLLETFTADSRRLRLGAIETASIELGGNLAIGVMPLLTLGSAIAVILLLNLLFYRTALGRAFRATSDDLEIAQLMGIDHHRIYSITMGIAMVVATIAALYLGIRANFDPTIGPARLIYAFEAVIIGGLGSLWGTLAGGIIIGLAQTVGAKLNPEWQILAGHIAFLVVVVLRPRGLFPRAVD